MRDRSLKYKGFFTQTELMEAFKTSETSKTKPTKEFCGPLANLYAKQRLGLIEGNFLQQNTDDILKMTLEEQQHQARLSQEIGAKGELFSAFHDAKLPYEAKVIDNGPSKRLLDEVASYSNHVLINFPTPPSEAPPFSSYHQIYLGRFPGTNRCAYFNGNRPGGEFIAECSKVTQQIFEDMQKEALFDGRPTLFGMAKK